MTNEELAAHWKVSLDEVQSISDYMNKIYSMHVGKNKKDGLFYGLIYRMDEKHGPMLSLSSQQGFNTPAEAASFLNDVCDRIQMPEVRAGLMNVPTDAYKALKKIDINAFSAKNQNINVYEKYAGRD